MKISIIIPCYNNADSLPELWSRLDLVCQKEIFQDHKFEFVFVDDGSKDTTFEEINNLEPKKNIVIRLVKLTKNFGSYNSFLAGMSHATGECNVYLHADLQDPPELIEELFLFFKKGIPLVIANRESREDGNIFSTIYHKMIKKFALEKAPEGGYDLIMFSAKIREEIVAIGEKNTNIVYLISWLGYPFAQIPYKRVKRKHGQSQWSTIKKIHLFVDTVFSFTNIPIFLIRLATIFILLNAGLSIIAYFLNPCLELLIWLSVAIVLLIVASFGIIITEYITRIHETVRNRPNFVVEQSSLKSSEDID